MVRDVFDYPEGFRNLFFEWGVGDTYSYGIVGYQFCRYAGDSGRWRPMPVLYPMRFLVPLDPLEERVFVGYQRLTQDRTCGISERDVLLRPIGLSVFPRMPEVPAKQIGFVAIERSELTAEEVAALSGYDGLIACSRWGADVLRFHGLKRVRCVHQGVDRELFRPLRKRLFADRFVLFSGGQLCLRKAQDVVVTAARRFLAAHPDAFLIVAWRSAWEKLMVRELAQSRLVEPIEWQEDMGAGIAAWLEANGIPDRQRWVLGQVANRLMPQVLRECDVGVFPNRCEAGTNLVAMECLASGVPIIASRNSGHLDLAGALGLLSLRDQSPAAVPGWYESSVDELIERLEAEYEGWRSMGKTLSLETAPRIPTWEASVQAHLEAIEDLCGG